MWPEDIYEAGDLCDYRCSLGNCKRCVNRSSCGNKNKKEADGCDKYRPEIKLKKRRKK